MKDLVWDQRMLGAFKALACLTEEEENVLNAWAKGKSLAETAMQCCMSESTVKRKKTSIRKKYDALLRTEDLPARKNHT